MRLRVVVVEVVHQRQPVGRRDRRDDRRPGRRAAGSVGQHPVDRRDLHDRDVQPAPALLGHRQVGRVGQRQLQQRRQPAVGVPGRDRGAAPSGSGRPGSPTAIAELARPVMPPCARSAQSPSSSCSRAGQPAQQMRCMSSGETAGTSQPRRGGGRRHHLRGGHVGGRAGDRTSPRARTSRRSSVTSSRWPRTSVRPPSTRRRTRHPASHVLTGQHARHPSGV